MEHRLRIVPGDQQRLTRFAFNEVCVVGNDSRDVSVYAFLRAVGIHPRARAFASAGVRIEVPQTDVLLRRSISHFPNTHIRMNDRNVSRWCKVEIKELARNPEDAFAQLLEL